MGAATQIKLSEEAAKLLTHLKSRWGWETTIMNELYGRAEYPNRTQTPEQYKEQAMAHWQFEADAYGGERQRPISHPDQELEVMTFVKKVPVSYLRQLSAASIELQSHGLSEAINNGANDYQYHITEKGMQFVC
jgi:hypothetical protein